MKSFVILSELCALLLALSRMGRTWSLASIPLVMAIVSVAIASAIGLKPGAWPPAVGATAGLAGFLTANLVFQYNPAGDNEFYMTNLEYNRLYQTHLIQSCAFALLAVLLGTTVGIVLPRLLMASTPID